MIRVLHLLGALRPSGMEKMLLAAAPHWARHGVACSVLSTGDSPGSFAPTLKQAGYPIHHIPFHRANPLPHAWQIFRLLRTERFDALHLHTERAMIHYMLMSRLAGTPVTVLTKHARYPYTGLLRWRRTWQRRIIRWLGGRFVAVGPAVRDSERDRFRNPCQVIPNWFDPVGFRPADMTEKQQLRRELGLPGDRPILITAGNCDPVKNHRSLLRALAMLSPAIPPFLYLHLGEEGQERERQEADALGLADRVRFAGPQADAAPFMRASDLFVQCSLHEGFSLAALEGVACGLRTLFTRVPGLTEFNPLFPGLRYAGTTPPDLAAALGELLTLPPLDPDAQARQYETAKAHFSPERGVAAYAALYRPI